MAIQRIYGFSAAAEVLGYVKRVAYDSNSRVMQIEAVSVEECIAILRTLSIGSVQSIAVGGVGTAERMPEDEREVVRAFAAEQPEQPLENTTDTRKREAAARENAAAASELNKTEKKNESKRAVEPQEQPAEPASGGAEEAAAVVVTAEAAAEAESPSFDVAAAAETAAAALEESVSAKPARKRRAPATQEKVVKQAAPAAADAEPAPAPAAAPTPAPAAASAAASKGNGAASSADVPAEVRNAVKLRDIVGYLFDHGHTTAASLLKECERLQPHVPFLRRIPDLRDRIYRGCVSMGIPTE